MMAYIKRISNDQNTLSKYEKIRKRKEFLTIYQKGNRTYSNHFKIFTYEQEIGVKRLGLTVSKKAGIAVRRNRIKRLLREYFRLNKSQLLSDSQDILIVSKRNIPHLNYWDVCNELKYLFNKK